MFFIGIDLGTGGVRTIVCDEGGKVVAQSSFSLVNSIVSGLPEGWAEQNPNEWCQTVKESLSSVVKQLGQKRVPFKELKALACDSTSGTVIPVNKKGEPLYNALMYNDNRAVEEAKKINQVATDFINKMGYRFRPSDALSKVLWIKNHRPDIYRKTYKFLHAADFIVGKLSGNFNFSDQSNALKMGYDLMDEKWPNFIEKDLLISQDFLPKVLKPGEFMGSVWPEVTRETHLPLNLSIQAGATDGTCAFISSGASQEGDWNSTLGTTLVVKGISKNLIKDAQGRIYCHRHPDGYWLPGGASSSGGEWIDKVFPGRDLTQLNHQAPLYTPSSVFVYPLVRKGERLPFVDPEAKGWVEGKARDEFELYTAYLEGIAYIERWIYEILKELGAEVGNKIFVSGGGIKSLPWLKIRANTLQKTLIKTEFTHAALGSAILSASRTYYSSLKEATQHMVKEKERIHPQIKMDRVYQEKYEQFRKICREKGYE